VSRWRRLAQRSPFGHHWVRVVNDGWEFARCSRCGKERELYAEQFVRNFGQNPPPLHIPGVN
jgi:hypothetical protein